MSGFTDAFYGELTEFYKARALPSKPAYYNTAEQPSTWFPPVKVGGAAPQPLPEPHSHTVDAVCTLTHSHSPLRGGVPQVWEVWGADLTLSPVHKAGVGCVHAEKGISLRFPRFLRERPDKGCEEATESRAVASMFSAQHSRKE